MLEWLNLGSAGFSMSLLVTLAWLPRHKSADPSFLKTYEDQFIEGMIRKKIQLIRVAGEVVPGYSEWVF